MLDVVVEAEDAGPAVEGGSRVALIEYLAFILGSVIFWVMEFLEIMKECTVVWNQMTDKRIKQDQTISLFSYLFYIYLGYLRVGLKFPFLLYYLNTYLQWNWHKYVGLL